LSLNLIKALTVLTFALPALAFALAALSPRRILKRVDLFATTVLGASLVAALIVFIYCWNSSSYLIFDENFAWLPVSGAVSLNIGLMLDRLTAVMLVVVTAVSFFVYLFSTKYMEGDVRYGRYYCCLLLFSTSMLGLVLANNLLFLLIFWELVGLSSYLLIGHWFEKKSASTAAVKAFITTRIGDIGMLLGLLIVYRQTGSIQYADIFAAVSNGELSSHWRTLAGLGIFLGAMGKSAQFPLHVWLPDAMEGPTPVSALIHAATMVAAGVYLTGRMFPVFDSGTLLFIAYIGAFSAFFAATIALVQDDIKKVLAYSTISQLGYMTMALGTGGYVSGLFHLTTHAFFKAGLFLGAGAVIYAMHHEQSLSKYGGLCRKLPWTATCYLLFTLALLGFPGFSGFWSKDAILADTLTFAKESGHIFIPLAGFATVFLTAFYMFRQYLLTFTGTPRDEHAFQHAKEPPWQMLLPLLVLALLSIYSGGYNGKWFKNFNPKQSGFEQVKNFAEQGYQSPQVIHLMADASAKELKKKRQGAPPAFAPGGHSAHNSHSSHNQAMVLSTALGLLGILCGLLFYWEKRDGRSFLDPSAVRNRASGLYQLLSKKYYLDELYSHVIIQPIHRLAALAATFDLKVIDRAVNLCGWFGKFMAYLVELVDRIGLDGYVINGAAAAARSAGLKLARVQTGMLSQYLWALVSGVVVVCLICIWVI